MSIPFQMNTPTIGPYQSLSVSNATASFFAFNVLDSVSLNTVNLAFAHANAHSLTISLGLYSLSGSTISLANSLSAATNETNGANFWASITAKSSAQNITPGTWYWGVLISFSSSATTIKLFGNSMQVSNAYSPFFIYGAMTTSTNALPGSINTTALSGVTNTAQGVPMIIVSA